jgi:hypothetical protein
MLCASQKPFYLQPSLPVTLRAGARPSEVRFTVWV